MLTAPPFLNYQLLEVIHEGVDTILYRGKQQADQEPVILKILKAKYPTFEQVTRLRHEYRITANLDIEGIVKVYSLAADRNRLALVCEDIGGTSLKKLLASEQLSIASFLGIAIQLVKAIASLHQNKIIHKDIKPSNIIINPQTGQAKIAGFSVASRLSKETPQPYTCDQLEGTLAYMSPEQTGRMNRELDYRTDFYSLGVTFYEMLTGELPFQSDDPLEMVYCHIAKLPVAPQQLNSEIPAAISEIVMKLLAKNGEDRYQSAVGLKADLETCLTQLQSAGEIASFIPGQVDRCGQLLIPQKLYGREQEVAALLAAFDRVAGTCELEASTQNPKQTASGSADKPQTSHSELMLVSGYSGVGKSSLVKEVQKPIARQHGYFIAGKFDQFKRNIPYAALIQAFQSLMRQLLTERSTRLQVWQAKLLAALGSNGQVIIDVIPEVELIIGKQPPASQLCSMETQNRFNRILQAFIGVFAQKEHPLVIFLDDLQWADSASLQLMRLMMECESQYLLLIGAYRDNEVNPTHPLMQAIAEIQKTGIAVSTIILQPLAPIHVNQLVADTLNEADKEEVRELASLLFHKTQGNPFFLTQMLKALHQEQLLDFDFTVGRWLWNIEQIQVVGIADLNVVDLVASTIRRLPSVAQEALMLAACLGDRFDLGTLAAIAEVPLSQVAETLWLALQSGPIVPLNNNYKVSLLFTPDELKQFSFDESRSVYKFLHDRVQQAVYSLIPDDQKKATHFRIGRLLLDKTPSELRSERIFDIVNQLNVGVEFVVTPEQQYELAQLNLVAAQKAKASAAYPAALKYIAVGMEVLPQDAWTNEQLLAFTLYRERCECEYLCGNFERAEAWLNRTLSYAKSNLDKAEIYRIRMMMYGNLSRFVDGEQVGIAGLKLFGVELPETEAEREQAVVAELEQVRSSLQGREIADLVNLPEMTDPLQKACMSLLSEMQTCVFNSSPALNNLNSLKMVSLSLAHGNVAESAFGFANYGETLGARLGDYQLGYEFGKLALALTEKFQALHQAAKVYQFFASSIAPWAVHLKRCIPFNQRAYQIGLESGDLAYAGFALAQIVSHRLIEGDRLHEIYEEAQKGQSFYERTKDRQLIDTTITWQRLCLNLQGLTKNSSSLSDADFDEAKHLKRVERHGRFALSWYYLVKVQTLFIHKHYDEAMQMVLRLREVTSVPGHVSISECCFYDALATAAFYTKATPAQQQQCREALAKNRAKLKQWADSCPENFLHKSLLIEAENARISDQLWEAADLYDQAIAAAQAQEFVQNAAIASELAAKFYLTLGREKLAKPYLSDAYCGYLYWGATAKAKAIQKQYPHLITRSDQTEDFRLNVTETTLTTTSSGSDLDLSSVMKAARAITSEIVLDGLLQTLLKILLENAAADRGCLILSEQNQLLIEAAGTTQPQSIAVLQSIPVETSSDLPISIVNYVARTQESLLLNDVTQSASFSSDPYILLNRAKSILCTPILYQSKFIGVLYLENGLSKGAFTPRRLETLSLLTAQAAIAIENARLYAREQEKARELQQSLQRLQQTQAQLVQTEKISSLGQLVAGVAHEVNNPLSFIAGNLIHATEYFQDLVNLFGLYQKHFPAPPAEIANEIEEIDLEYLLEDLPELLNSMQVGIDRIRNIMQSLRNFSRLDEAPEKAVDIHSGLESTLMILQHRLKANSNRPAIQAIKEYGDLPLVECYAGQLNQVFMNLLANAIDALEERAEGREQEAGEGNLQPEAWNLDPVIRIRTELLNCDRVSIRIADNGPGIAETARSRLFDAFFTTKPEGKGTGLGLSISYQIVTEKHKGTLECVSTPGRGAEFIIQIPVKLS
jgi:predicted ATPase/signal transduction histidine kinase/tRNA A-37 threonylcarbamoyl transferase component Bud32